MIKVATFTLLFCATAVLSRPQTQKEPVEIVLQENDASVNGDFHYKFESADGTKVQQDGHLKDTVDEEGKPARAEEITGLVEYLGDDGKTYKITYVADENGYKVQGDHLPTPPPIPAAIQRSLDFIATAKPQQ